MSAETPLTIRSGRFSDAALVLEFIRELAGYEKLLHEVLATRADVERWVFGDPPHSAISTSA